MEKTLQFNMFKRTFLCLLCLILFISCVSLPFRVQASATATVAIASYGVIKLVVSSKLLVGLIVGSFAGFLIEPLLEETDEWYNENAVVRNWAESYPAVIKGGEVIPIPSNVQSAIRAKYKVDASVDLSTLYVPYDLLHLESVTATHVFGIDFASKLEANNALINKSNSLLGDIKTTFTTEINSLRSAMVNAMTTMSNSIVNVRDNIISTYVYMRDTLLPTLNTNIINTYVFMRDILVPTISNSIYDLHNTLRYNIDVLNENMANTYIEVRDGIVDKISSIDLSINALVDTIATSVDAKLDVIIESLATTANPPPFETPAVPEDNLAGSVTGGSNAFILLLGQAMDLISKYRVAFLALGILISKFLAVGFVGDLVVFGLAIGLFGLLVDLTSQYLKAGSMSSSNKSSKKTKTSKKKKKGG